ncbi:L-seryl-tRNA(Sec) selenium transferase [Bacillaceae bacterium W0354]
MGNEMLRFIRPVHELIQHKKLVEFSRENQLSNTLIKTFVVEATNAVRKNIQNDLHVNHEEEVTNLIINQTIDLIRQFLSPRLQRVINGTGTILHTNLGRANIPESAINRVVEVARYYSTLEYNYKKGKRGSRHDLVEHYLTKLTNAESALVVNNNAASVYMILKAFAKAKEVIVSRGELVEIGGSFRVSSIMDESDAILKEVGTTNKTHLYDYEQAINEDTKMIMKVHPSNFKMIGFTSTVDRKQLVELAKTNNLIYYEDLGSGMFVDLKKWGIGDEPLVKDVVKSGADIISFSGDKLLGGPQVGIIVGKKKWIDYLKQHQLARVLRVDKMTYAALEETLKLTFTESFNKIPTLQAILTPFKNVKNSVDSFIKQLPTFNQLSIRPIQTQSNIGGGTLPEETIDSYGLHLSGSCSANFISEELRKKTPPLVCRISEDKAIIDFRTIHPDDQPIMIEHFKHLDRILSN